MADGGGRTPLTAPWLDVLFCLWVVGVLVRYYHTQGYVDLLLTLLGGGER